MSLNCHSCISLKEQIKKKTKDPNAIMRLGDGNKKIKDDVIKAELTIKSRNVYKKSDLQDSISIIRELYKQTGYFSAIFKPKISQLSQNRVNINIRIIENYKTKIKSIRFIGNKIFSDKRLKGIISTKESKFYRERKGPKKNLGQRWFPMAIR